MNQSPEILSCPRCGKPLREPALYCRKCGTSLEAPPGIEASGDSTERPEVAPDNVRDHQIIPGQGPGMLLVPLLLLLALGIMFFAFLAGR